jgi:hypothetical protein
VLTVQFYEQSCKLAQHGEANRLIIDGGAAGPVAGLNTPHDDVAFNFDFMCGQKRHGGVIGWKIIAGGDAAFILAGPDQICIATRTEGQTQSIEQYRFSGAGFTGQNREATRQLQVQFLNQYNITNGKSSQHEHFYSRTRYGNREILVLYFRIYTPKTRLIQDELLATGALPSEDTNV